MAPWFQIHVPVLIRPMAAVSSILFRFTISRWHTTRCSNPIASRACRTWDWTKQIISRGGYWPLAVRLNHNEFKWIKSTSIPSAKTHKGNYEIHPFNAVFNGHLVTDTRIQFNDWRCNNPNNRLCFAYSLWFWITVLCNSDCGEMAFVRFFGRMLWHSWGERAVSSDRSIIVLMRSALTVRW